MPINCFDGPIPRSRNELCHEMTGAEIVARSPCLGEVASIKLRLKSGNKRRKEMEQGFSLSVIEINTSLCEVTKS